VVLHRGRAQTRGFTLIEILMVMAIIITLTALLSVGLMGARDKAKNKGSKALVSKIKIALESYYADFRDYPPDGFDLEPGWTAGTPPVAVVYPAPMGAQWDINDGIKCGTPGTAGNPRQFSMKNTAALMYFLCRPLIKVTFIGSDMSDPRNMVRKKVGPYMELTGSNFSMPQRIRASSGEPVDFSPAYRWDSSADSVEYWETMGFRKCEIIDAYGRPLVYDKVKTSDPVPAAGGAGLYWDPARVQLPGVTAPGKSQGSFVHPDREHIDNMDLMYENEPEGYIEAESTFLEILEKRFDPRFRVAAPGTAGPLPPGNDVPGYLEPLFAEGGGAPDPSPGTDATHAPQFTGGYDLWSMGRSWIDPRDDIKSWGD
jgi:prepilin-type N-terminal cleavage/methylation domain-containing protein